MIRVFTDGSVSRPREGRSPGGWAYLFSIEDKRYDKFGGYLDTTNNRMEVTAAVKALRRLVRLGHAGAEVVVISDSQYLIQGASIHMQAWKYRGLFNKYRTKLKNKDLWIEIDELSKQFKTRWQWIKGHRGQADNERCDGLAWQGSLRALGLESIQALP